MRRSATPRRAHVWSAAVVGCALVWSGSSGESSVVAQSVRRIGADRSAMLLTPGTDVVVGIIDSGVDETHPSLATLDSRGRSRQVAEFNFVPTEPDNTGDDLAGHGTAVAGVILANDVEYPGVAPDARFVNARALDATSSFELGTWPENATAWAIEQRADVLNVSLNFFSTEPISSDGSLPLDLMLDWAAFSTEYAVPSAACVGNISGGDDGINTPRSPGGSFNTITVGQTGLDDYSRLHEDSGFGPTSDGRQKPDLVAPGRNLTLPSQNWETAADFVIVSGCSFATPHVAGVLTQLIGYAKGAGSSTDPMLLKATLLNSAEKVTDVDGNAWEPASATVVDGVWQTDAPLDDQLGAGQVDALAAAYQYLAGPQAAGAVNHNGWALATVGGETSQEYSFNVVAGVNTVLTSTLTWFRHVERLDDGNGQIDAADSFQLGGEGDGMDNLDLTLLHNGQPVASSASTVDNVEHLRWSISESGQYTWQVSRQTAENSGDDEPYALAWSTLGFRGDIDRNGIFDGGDIDYLNQQIRAAANRPDIDLNQDGEVDVSDRDFWVETIAKTFFGDANLDGEFNSSDLTLVFQAGQYEDLSVANSRWSTGDWDGDREFATSDLVLAFQSGGYEAGPRPATVPEPTTVGLWSLVGLLALRTWLSTRGSTAR